MEETETKEADIGTNSTSVSASVTVEEIQAPKKGHHNPFSFVSKLLGMFGSKHGSKDGSRGSNLSNAGSSSNAASPRFGSPNRFIINNKAEYFFTGGESVILRLNSKTTVSSHSPAPSVSSLDPSSLLSTAMKKGAANARYYLPAHLLKRMGGEKGLNQNEMYEASRRVYDPTTKIIKEGYLEKQGYTNINLWKRRYFVLKDTGIFWFEEQSQFQEKAPPKGMILFLDVFGDIDSGDYLTDKTTPASRIHHKNAVRFYPSNMKNLLGREHVFALMHVKNGSSDRSFFFSHEDKEQLLSWATAVDEEYHKYLDARDNDLISATSAMRGKPIPLSTLHELHKIFDDFVETSGVLTRDHLARKILLAWYLHVQEKKLSTAGLSPII